MFPVCYGGYLRLNEDKTSFNKPGWKPVDSSTNKDELFRLCPKSWRYQSAEDTDTVPKWGQFSFYPGGGFVADLGYENSTGFTLIETLQSNNWLDRRTRAIILEFSSFNPSVNLLCIATYFYEVEASGYSTPFTRTEVISLDSTGAGSQQFYLICILFFIIFVAFYLGRECYRLYKQRSRYFKSLWGWVEIFQVLFSLLAVVMYIVRSKKATSTIQKLQNKIYENLSFQEVMIWLEIENAALGILTFIVTAKLLRLIRFNQPAVDKPTRVYGNSATLIDNIFSNNLENSLICGNIVTDTTDHFTQVCIVAAHPNPLNYSKQRKKIRDYSSFNANRFLSELQEIEWSNSSDKDANKSFTYRKDKKDKKPIHRLVNSNSETIYNQRK